MRDEKLTTPEVEAALERLLAGGEVGIQVAANVHGRPIVDTWAGVTAPGGDIEVDGRTLFTVWSIAKALTAVALHVQVERGRLDYDDLVIEHWPEYGQNGKEATTVRDVLLHRAGNPLMPPDVTPEQLGDWDWMVEQVAAMKPLLPPNTRNMYHSYTSGWLLGELVRRTDPEHRPFGQFVQEEVCEPLGIDSFFLGLPPEHLPRMATLSYPQRPPEPPDDHPRWLAAPRQVNFVPDVYNRDDVRTACLAASGAIANARSVARFFAMLAGRGELDGVRLLSEERVMSFLQPRPDYEAPDYIYKGVMLMGMGGTHLDPRGVIKTRPGERVLCQVGAGSNVAWADVDTGLSFAICHSRMVANPVISASGDRTGPTPPMHELGDVLRDLVVHAA